MTGIQIFVEWIASLIEMVLYLKIIGTISECQFPKKKQDRYFWLLSASIAVGIVTVSYTHLTLPTT